MRKLDKNSMDWLFNRPDALSAVSVIGARNLTVVETVITPTVDKEEVIESYSKMVEHDRWEADTKLYEWIKNTPERSNGLYVYFRFRKIN